ncbi:MAG: radical SAM protein [Solidesulfovibrio sp. DCME]|uniref:radical SAM protein n=1 Tax=Solidesulfovibrio sp. DCME TaxID=3447380 RepID=UPI003D0F6339
MARSYCCDGPALWSGTPWRRRLFLGLTTWCNARCEHCATDSSPAATARMGWDDALHILEQAAALGFELAVLSGGEVMGRFDEVLALVRQGARLGLRVWIESNGFWGGVADQARAAAHRLRDAGLEQLVFSTDAYHLPDVPLESFLRAVDAAEAVGLGYHVDMTESHLTEAHNELLAQLREAGIEPYIWVLSPLGRARDLPDRAFRSRPLASCGECDGLCFAFDPWARAWCCCNFRQHGQESRLSLGSLRGQTFTSLAHAYRTSHDVALIAAGALRHAPPDSAMARGGPCEVCQRMLGDPGLTDEWRKRCASDRRSAASEEWDRD